MRSLTRNRVLCLATFSESINVFAALRRPPPPPHLPPPHLPPPHLPPPHSSERIAHKSGNAGWLSVVSRYSAPADPPVPAFVPIVRCTIFTWRYRHSINPSSRSTTRSATCAANGLLRYTSIRIRWTSGEGS